MKEMMTSRARVVDASPRQQPRNEFHESALVSNGYSVRTSSPASVSSSGSALSFDRSDTPRSTEGMDIPHSVHIGTDSDEDNSSESASGTGTATDWNYLPLTTHTFPLSSSSSTFLPASSSASLPPPLPSREIRGQGGTPLVSSLPGSLSNFPHHPSRSKDRYMKLNTSTLVVDSDYVTMRRVDCPQQGRLMVEYEGCVGSRQEPPPVPPHANSCRSAYNTFPKTS